ncbi:cytochrome c [Alphaproteobacteria bacterium]|nr:cytochrome c [Alphaproteobacteria bacterium]
MKNWLKPFVLVAVGFGFIATLQVDVAAADPVNTRRAVMKELSAHNKAIKKYLKGHKNAKKQARLGSPGDVELRAIAMAGLAKRMPAMFANGTSLKDMPGKTRAKPAIWAQSKKFKAAAMTLSSWANDLEGAAATGDKSKIAAVMKGFGKAACGGCHKTFRGPKINKKKKM